MIKFFAILMICLNLFTFGINNDNVIEQKNLQVDTELVDNSENSVYFDFGSELVSDTNIIDIKIIDDFNVVPTINTTGNIEIDILSTNYNLNYLRIYLPDSDGYLQIYFEFGDKHMIKEIYSSKGEDKYAISSLPLYSAWSLVGNLPYQEYMDNDEIDAIYVETPDFTSDREQNDRVIANGSVYGYLRWTDDNNVNHPLIGVKVKLTWDGSFGEAYTYTNSSGYFYISFNNMWTVSDYGCYVHIYSKTSMCDVAGNNLIVYEKVEKLTLMQNGENYNYGTYTFSPAQDGDLGRAMQIITALYNYSEYAKSLNGGENIPICSLVYPSNDDNAFYNNIINTIYLGHETQDNPYLSTAGSWDIIGHEYGHHLQHYFFNQFYYGTHYFYKNDIYSFFESSGFDSIDIDFAELRDGKVQGTCLAFKESWPSFFAVSAQSTFSNDIKTIPTVGNYIYEQYNGATANLESLQNNNYYNPNIVNGESDELIIMCFLYRLWEANNIESWDNISISDTNLWNLMCNSNPANLSDFVNDLYNSSLSFSRSDLGKILEVFKISASNLSISSNSLTNYSSIPSFSWDRNGQDITYDGETYNYSNDKFDLLFYDESNNLIMQKQNIYSNYVTLTQSEWIQLLEANGNNYSVLIKSYSTLGSLTGPYYSQKYTFNKPNAALYSVNFNDFYNMRYYEKDIYIRADTSWTFDIKFNHAGNKLFQTFGDKDTKMYLYYSDGITPVCNPSDDEGYGLNSYIYKYLQANTTYKLVVNFYNSNLSGMTKVSFMSVGGFKNLEDDSMSEYECIWHIHNWQNYTFNTYVSQYNSMVVTFTPPVSGNYTISLESEFDNYLYVINPTSYNALVQNVDYNDDSNNSTNAALTKYFDTNITYLIVFCQYNPTYIFSNLDSGDDIILRINRV